MGDEVATILAFLTVGAMIGIPMAIAAWMDRSSNIKETKRFICVRKYATEEERKRISALRDSINHILERNAIFLATADVHTQSHITGRLAFLFEEKNREISRHNLEVEKNRRELHDITNRTDELKKQIKTIEDKIYAENQSKLGVLAPSDFKNTDWEAIDIPQNTLLCFPSGWYITCDNGLRRISDNLTPKKQFQVGKIYQ